MEESGGELEEVKWWERQVGGREAVGGRREESRIERIACIWKSGGRV